MTSSIGTSQALPNPAPLPDRIQRISLTDFRAFPGPTPATIELDGKNLLVYGENGSGKSSFFHALAGFFSPNGISLLESKNVFSGQPESDCKISVEYVDDNVSVDWTPKAHPCVLDFDTPVTGHYQYYFGNTDQRTVSAGLRAACLDYKSLLNTNFRHGQDGINLFDIAVTQLLRDYPVASGGQTMTVGDLWRAVNDATPAKHTGAAIERINGACLAFNAAFQPAVQALLPKVNELMAMMGWQEVVLNALSTPGLTYQPANLKRDRIINGQSLTPDLSFHGHRLDRPQLFLNEARLSALGLAIYLAGRLTCTPTTTPGALKLLVLDDVLIGLDQANRIPVLDVLQQHFFEWQIVLLTHDRAFYEIGKQRLDSGKWIRQEIYAGRVGNFEKPLLVDDELDLYRALAFLDKGEIKAAAVHVRSAFERVLKDACCDLHVPVKYHHDPRKVPASDLWSALSSNKYKAPAKTCFGTKQGKPIRWITKEVEVSVVPQQLANRINHSVSWVLNPLSHSQTVDRYRREIEDAIYAVDDLAVAVHRALQVQRTRPIELLQYLATVLNARAVQLAAST